MNWILYVALFVFLYLKVCDTLNLHLLRKSLEEWAHSDTDPKLAKLYKELHPNEQGPCT